ncbi:hypothetical protein AAFC00_002330 [Neodothiora populina]
MNHPPFLGRHASFPSHYGMYPDQSTSATFATGSAPGRESRQVAYPVQGHSGYVENAAPVAGAVLTTSEHMLRRKTPGGTINGAYESNAHDTQPVKYTLIPRNDIPHGYGQFPQLDSFLQQGPYRQLHSLQTYNQTVPSVIQPPFQHLGPTASGTEGRGPYGPYWNDGTYIPYRPAAQRDPRFNATQQQADVRWDGDGGCGRMSTWQHEALMPLAYPVSSSSRSANWPTLTHGGLALPHPHGTPDPTRMHDQGPPLGPSPATAQYREEILHWALQVYRDLLSYVHQVKKLKQQNGQTSSAQPRPSFYPQPPKLSGAPFPSPSHPELAVQADDSTPRPTESTPYPLRDALNREQQLDRKMPPPSSYRSATASQRPQPMRHLSSPVTSVAQIIDGQDNSPPSRAISALAVVSKLCQETDWQWIDGMHLGGCLAYGLGNHAKAQRWYEKVLELDPKHIEAASNLAATLVLLGQPNEAEQHWRKVVRDAPYHFEAVEHLVGLLCQSHRARDAINIIDYVQHTLRIAKSHEPHRGHDSHDDCSMSNTSKSPSLSDASDKVHFDYDAEGDYFGKEHTNPSEPGFGTSGYAIPGCDNGRILALIHAKGNMLYSMGDNLGAAKSFEDAVLLALGRNFASVQGLVKHVLSTITAQTSPGAPAQLPTPNDNDPVLLYPEQAAQTARACFPHCGELAGLRYVPCASGSVAKNAAIATTSNSLLSLAKIFQDNMTISSQDPDKRMIGGVRDILAIYYLSLSLQPSPSTANNVGILLAGVQQIAPVARSVLQQQQRSMKHSIPGVAPGSGIALALAYYNYGLMLDNRHAHLYTNLGSLLKDIGQLDAAIEMYKSAVQCDAKFDIALANLANAVKDKGRISDAIEYYKRAVDVNPSFAEAVCGLANALNSVCGWQSRGGIANDGAKRDRWHVDHRGMLIDGSAPGTVSSGWIKRVVDIVEKQLVDGEDWGRGVLTPSIVETLARHLTGLEGSDDDAMQRRDRLRKTLYAWTGKKWEGARVTRLVERASKRVTWQWYQDKYVRKRPRPHSSYLRPYLPATLPVPHAPTVLPFHTFTAPMSAKQIRLISQRNGYRISASTLRLPWLRATVSSPPPPPRPFLKVGYVSSDFNNHPLAHLMQSVFGLHDPTRAQAICYATTASDRSIHRQQIEQEAPVFRDASQWSSEQLVNKIVEDGCHILVNLNGYTRGARNEVFAARPAPIQMSFMGFAGTLGAEWCDYLLADETAVPPSVLRPWRRNVDIEDALVDDNDGPNVSSDERGDDWVYGENIIYCRDTFFCCDHKQSAPDSQEEKLDWDEEQKRRWHMRKELFPTLADDAIIFANFNQLYKIEPTTFRTWLRILSAVPNSILWLLRFPDLGESHLKSTAALWAGHSVASRIIFTDVAPKHLHIARAKVCDLFLDTAECNAHTTAADCLWSGTPLLTRPRWEYKMCSRMAASILRGALPRDPVQRRQCERDLIADSEEEYENLAIQLGRGLYYPKSGSRDVGFGRGRLVELRRLLTEGRWSSGLFDTKRWVHDLEDAMEEAWSKWERGEGGDIWLDDVPVGGRKDTSAETNRRHQQTHHQHRHSRTTKP